MYCSIRPWVQTPVLQKKKKRIKPVEIVLGWQGRKEKL
jgi:hypothetical protein